MNRQIFFRYKKKQFFKVCPLCGRGITWTTDGISWFPCDEEPVLFIPDIGFEMVFKKRDIIRKVKILRAGQTSPAPGIRPEYGLESHLFTCPELKKVGQYGAKGGGAFA